MTHRQTSITDPRIRQEIQFSFVASFRSADSLGQTIKYSVPQEMSERPTPFEIEQSQNRAREASAKSSRDGRLPVAVRFEALPPGVRAGEETTVQGGRTLTLADGTPHALRDSLPSTTMGDGVC